MVFSSMFKNYIKPLLIVDIILLNIFALYVAYGLLVAGSVPNTNSADALYSQNAFDQIALNNERSEADIVNSANTTSGSQVCPASCIEKIDEAVSASVITYTPAPVISTSKPKSKSVSYLPIPGSGNTLNSDWTNIDGTDFYMKAGDYEGLLGVYFEANIKLQNGNGEAFVRLYDVTNSRGVDASSLSTKEQTSTFVSGGPISLWAGYNHYKIQIKTLTADTAYYESGRLKIITNN